VRAERPARGEQPAAARPARGPNTAAKRPAKEADARTAKPGAPRAGAPARPEAPRTPPPKKKPKAHSPRSGRIAIVGQPNVGKSTLLNALLGQKLSIVSEKPGTTRQVLLGVAEHVGDEGELTQLALLDTPGLEQPRSVLGRALMEEAQGALEGVDAVLFLVDVEAALRARGLGTSDTRILAAIAETKRPFVIALNKVDRVRDKGRLLPLLEHLSARGASAIVPISARRGTGLDGVVKELRAHLGEGLALEAGTLTDRPERFFVAELVREAILERTEQEVPHGVAVVVEEWVDEGKHVRVGVSISVDKEGHKGILIGAKGQKLKEIGEAARAGIEDLIGRHVFLRTFVKVAPGWTKDEASVTRALREGEP
jgi:GTP-binding protein Era